MSLLSCEKISVIAKLYNGSDSQGSPKYINLSLGTLNDDAYCNGYDSTMEGRQAYGDKVLNIAEALAPCLSKTIRYVQEVVTYNLTTA